MTIIVIIFFILYFVLLSNIKIYIVKEEYIKVYIKIFYIIKINLNYSKLKQNFDKSKSIRNNKIINILNNTIIYRLKVVRIIDSINIFELVLFLSIKDILKQSLQNYFKEVKDYNISYQRDIVDKVQFNLEFRIRVFRLLYSLRS